MLSISVRSLETLETAARPQFARRLRDALAAKYAHFLPRFAEPVQLRIVANMLGRAARWQIRTQQGLLAFGELMVAVAANFDQQPEIRSVLEASHGAGDAAVLSLPGTIASEVWDAAMRNATTLPFYTTPGLDREPPGNQAAAALPVVLYDRAEAATPTDAVDKASGLAPRLRVSDPDGDTLMVFAACRSFYGDALDDGRLPWLPQVLAAQLGQRALANALRLRLALDFARFV